MAVHTTGGALKGRPTETRAAAALDKMLQIFLWPADEVRWGRESTDLNKDCPSNTAVPPGNHAA